LSSSAARVHCTRAARCGIVDEYAALATTSTQPGEGSRPANRGAIRNQATAVLGRARRRAVPEIPLHPCALLVREWPYSPRHNLSPSPCSVTSVHDSNCSTLWRAPPWRRCWPPPPPPPPNGTAAAAAAAAPPREGVLGTGRGRSCGGTSTQHHRAAQLSGSNWSCGACIAEPSAVLGL
jgi:hypothetical protein